MGGSSAAKNHPREYFLASAMAPTLHGCRCQIQLPTFICSQQEDSAELASEGQDLKITHKSCYCFFLEKMFPPPRLEEQQFAVKRGRFINLVLPFVSMHLHVDDFSTE